jgi:hypothetical protein
MGVLPWHRSSSSRIDTNALQTCTTGSVNTPPGFTVCSTSGDLDHTI